MIRRLLAPALLAALVASGLLVAIPGTASGGTQPYRPDAWIKLCGLSNGCKINGLPHPWKGRNVYNHTGKRQSVGVRMQDGEGVRFWLALETDGTDADTLRVDGCRGNRRFRVNKVQIGKYKNPNAGAVKITEKFKKGTATFDYGANSDKVVFLTLNIIAPTTAEGVSYTCRIDLISQGDPDKYDTLKARMTTY